MSQRRDPFIPFRTIVQPQFRIGRQNFRHILTLLVVIIDNVENLAAAVSTRNYQVIERRLHILEVTMRTFETLIQRLGTFYIRTVGMNFYSRANDPVNSIGPARPTRTCKEKPSSENSYCLKGVHESYFNHFLFVNF